MCCTGELLKAIARRVLHLPLLRFVDDYFAVEATASAEHAMQVFARQGTFSVSNVVEHFACLCIALQAGKGPSWRGRNLQEETGVWQPHDGVGHQDRGQPCRCGLYS